MSETRAPERVWLDNTGDGWKAVDATAATAIAGDVEYVRADVVQGLVEALRECSHPSECNRWQWDEWGYCESSARECDCPVGTALAAYEATRNGSESDG